MIYFDYAATTPMSDKALQTYNEVATKYFGNTNSLHDLGSRADQLLDQCKLIMANLIGGEKDKIYFTSGGSEANMLGIKLLTNQDKRRHVIMSTAEHNSNHQMTRILEAEGYNISLVPFNGDGQINMECLKNEINSETVLVIVQHINGEIGSIQPIEEIACICETHNIYLHIDCVQSFGKLDLTKITPLVDSLSVSAHKLYGPKGIGFLYSNHSHQTGFEQLLLNGNTHDLPSIAAFTVAADEAVNSMESEIKRVVELRNSFIKGLEPIRDFVTIYESHYSKQLPSVLGMGIEGIEGQWVMLECNRNGFAISTGSACDVKYHQTPNTLRAINESHSKAKEFFRISFGRHTSIDEVKELARFLVVMTLQYKGIADESIGGACCETKNVSR